MAIEPVMADVIRQLAPTLPNRRVLSLGYPDILTLAEPPTDAERVSIAAWHRWKWGVEDAGHFFGKQELEPEYWDVTQARGPEKVVDLNEVESGDYQPGTIGGAWFNYECLARQSSFGLVIDPGTLEHIANVGNAWRALHAVTALNGIIVHANPCSMLNHGFYNFSPTLYLDLYEANGFKVELLLEMCGPREKRELRDVQTFGRYQPRPEAMLLCVARKKADVPFAFPRQRKYQINPMLKAAQ